LRVLLELVRQRAMAMAQPGPLAPWAPAQERLAKPSERQEVLVLVLVLVLVPVLVQLEASCYPMLY